MKRSRNSQLRKWKSCQYCETLEARTLLAGDLIAVVESQDADGGTTDILACFAAGFTPPEPVAAEPVAALPADVLSRDTLMISTPANYLSGSPILVRLELRNGDQVDRDVWDATVSIHSDNDQVQLSETEVTLVNGLGSVLVTPTGSEPFNLVAEIDGLSAMRALSAIDMSAAQDIAGTLTGTETQWSGVVHVTGDVVVPSGHVLTVEPGTLVLLEGKPQTSAVQLGAKITVQGTLNSNGTAAAPVTFTAADLTKPWGELNADGGQITLNYTDLTRAGSTTRGGHTGTGPAIRMGSDATVSLVHSNVSNIAGKILQSTSGTLNLHDSLLTRAVMGPEINNTQLDFLRTWIVDMAGRFHHNGTVDDNDGIYLHAQRAGQTITLTDGVVAGSQDDTVDTLGSTNVLDGMIIRDSFDKNISVFRGETTVNNSLLVNGDIGIEAKGDGNAHVIVNLDGTTIAKADHAIRGYDKDAPDPNVRITFNIVNSILHVNAGGDPIFTDYDPNDIQLNYSWSEEAWNHVGSGTGNLVSTPQFVDLDNNDFHLPAGSPAIDAGDPASPLDADGTRVEMGFYAAFAELPSADINGDGTIDALDIDLICAAVVNNDNGTQFDLDGSGQVDKFDYDFLIDTVLGTQPGDANLDGQFTSSDLVFVFSAGQYENQEPAGWAEGDWDCDGLFTTSDLVRALQFGYEN
ncbi:MAG: hypothetical protein KDA92_04075 [Planctomycetales bacterium]|nr:hypothetical protein [Planctomycetales bacterium]